MTAAPGAGPSSWRVVVGIAGTEGLEYSIELLERLAEVGAEAHLVVAPAAERALGSDLARVRALAAFRYDHENQAARIASGSFLTHGMTIAPCDPPTLHAVVRGLASDLVLRAADVTLKERRPLVVGLSPSSIPLPDDTARLSGLPGAAVVVLEGDTDAAAGAVVDQLRASASR